MSETVYSPEFAALQGAVAGRYSLVRELGRGGMGIVFLARDVALDRLVAIKLLPPDLAREPEFRARFLREARMAASLAHPHIVPIHAVEATDDAVFFVMAFVDGESLGGRVRRRGPLGISDTTRIVQEVAWALAHAHARGIVHRDVKPDNILIDRESGRALVTDFGIARALADPAAHGTPAGTPHYLSPEQSRGETGDARSDLYALGVTAWHALTAGYPFTAPNVAMLLVRQATESAPSLATAVPAAPSRLVRVIDRCLAKDPASRHASAEELATDLNAVRARNGELPGPVRAWVREVLPAGNDIGMGLGGVGFSLAAWWIMVTLIAGEFLGAGGEGIGAALDLVVIRAVMTIAAALFGGLALVRLGSVVTGTRDLVESGYDHAAAVPGLIEAEAEHRADVTDVPRAERRRRAMTQGAIGVAKSGLAIALATVADSEWITIPAMVLSILLPMITARTVWGLLSEGPSPWSRLLRGRLGRAMFRFAGLFTRRRGAIADDAQPTIVALGHDVESLFRALPPAARAQLHDLPVVLEKLRTRAEHLRAGDAHEEHVSGVVAAMESVRLELLRMSAGASTVPDVTRNLEEARRIAERVDRALRSPEAPESGVAAEIPELERTG